MVVACEEMDEEASTVIEVSNILLDATQSNNTAIQAETVNRTADFHLLAMQQLRRVCDAALESSSLASKYSH